MCTQLMSHDKGPLVDQDMPWLFVTEIKTNVAAICWSDRANLPTKKDEKHLGAVWSNILISPSCLFADGKAREGHRPLFTLRYLTAQTLLKSKRFEAPTNQHTTPPPPSFGFVWKWTQKCEKPDEGKQSIILTYVPAFENGCVMTNVVLIINPMPFPHLPVS